MPFTIRSQLDAATLGRAQDVTPTHIVTLAVRAIKAHLEDLNQGALVTIDDVSARVRVLPLR